MDVREKLSSEKRLIPLYKQPWHGSYKSMMDRCYRKTAENERTVTGMPMPDLKPCYGKCERCVWKYNGGCSEWNGWYRRARKEEA